MNAGPDDEENELTFPVTEERLDVQRRVTDTGRTLRVRKRVHDEPVEVREQAFVETVETRRVPIGRVLDAPVEVRHEGDTTIVPIVEERVVTRKELVLVEEIHLTRRREVREMRGEVKLRKESVVIERFDPATQQWLSDDEG